MSSCSINGCKDVKKVDKTNGLLVEENNNDVDSLEVCFKKMGNITDKIKEKSLQNRSKDNVFICMDANDVNMSSETDDDFVYDYNDDFEDDFEHGDMIERVTVATVHRDNQIVDEQNSSNSKRASLIEPETKFRQDVRVAEKPEMIQTIPSVEKRRRFISNNTFNSNASIASTAESRSRRINMSFTNDRSREIHRENHILMKKLLKTKSTRASTPNQITYSREASSAIIRRRNQDKRDRDNLVLLRKIQCAKSSNLSFRK